MTILEWGSLGLIMAGVLFFCARAMRKGLRTLDDDRARYMERIRDEELRAAEDSRNISALEHLHIARAALEDLLRLDGNPAGYRVLEQGMAIEFLTPAGSWRIELAALAAGARSAGRVLDSRSRWILSGSGSLEEHMDTGSLMRSLNAHLHSACSQASEPEHLARRMSGIESIAGRFRI